MKDEIKIKNPPPAVCRRQQIDIDGARVRHFCIRFHRFGSGAPYVPGGCVRTSGRVAPKSCLYKDRQQGSSRLGSLHESLRSALSHSEIANSSDLAGKLESNGKISEPTSRRIRTPHNVSIPLRNGGEAFEFFEPIIDDDAFGVERGRFGFEELPRERGSRFFLSLRSNCRSAYS